MFQVPVCARVSHLCATMANLVILAAAPFQRFISAPTGILICESQIQTIKPAPKDP
jgi:hypothetical protein